MEAVIFLSIIIALFSILVSCFAIRRVKKQIAEITDALIDVKNGNGNRRILSATNELVAPLAYEINEIVAYSKNLFNSIISYGWNNYIIFHIESTSFYRSGCRFASIFLMQYPTQGDCPL